MDSANYIFEQIMGKSLGGIEYDEDAKLVAGASFEPYGGRTAGKTEVVLVEQKSEDAFLQKKSLEAAVIGEKIRDMVQGENPLFVNGKNGYRPVEYGDIAILLRSLAGWSDEFIEVLNDMGIPAYADTKTGYFTALEVETILNLLHIVDNPRQDIPLTAVLRSCLGEITDEELAWIGTMPGGVNFWDKTVYFLKSKREGCPMEGGEAVILEEKLAAFVERLEDYRHFALTHSVYELLRKIYEETGYYHLMAAMPSGEKHQANLDILLQQSLEFAQNGHQGIYGFTRYIESLRKSNVDFGEAAVNGENTNAVRIMTIHKSKGLEFPVVFVAGMGKQFNLMDARKSTVIDGDYGVGCDFVDLELRVKQPTLLKRFMVNQITQNTLAEEIRILYVALTRAKEQLIITGTASGLVKKLAGWLGKAAHLGFFQLSSAQTYLDWIMPALLKRNSLNNALEEYLSEGGEREAFSSAGGDELFQVMLTFPENIKQDEKAVLADAVGQYRMLENWDTSVVYDGEMHGEIERQSAYYYPYVADTTLPVKISVSELKRQSEKRVQSMEEEAAVFLENEGNPLPEFLKKNKAVDRATRGTLYHLVMEHFPYHLMGEKEWEADDFKIFLEEMVRDGYMREEESRLLDVGKFVIFAKSRIGRRMSAAQKKGFLRREQPFMLGLGADEIFPESTSKEMVMVQGIIDAFFFEEDKIVLVDYKTDFVRHGQEEKLAEKYQTQLAYYAEALERLTGLAVAEKIIYSFAVGKEIVLK